MLVVGVSEIDRILIGESVIDPDIPRILQQRPLEDADPVGIDERIHVRQIRQGRPVKQEFRDRAESRGIDHVGHAVEGHRQTRPVRLGRQGVVEGRPASLGIDEATEIAITHFRRRYRHAGGRVGQETSRFPIEEEKRTVGALVQLWNVQRAAQRQAELVAIRVRGLGEIILAPPRDAVSAVAVGIEQHAMILIGAGPRRHDYRGWAGELRRGVVDFDANLFD